MMIVKFVVLFQGLGFRVETNFVYLGGGYVLRVTLNPKP